MAGGAALPLWLETVRSSRTQDAGMPLVWPDGPRVNLARPDLTRANQCRDLIIITAPGGPGAGPTSRYPAFLYIRMLSVLPAPV